MHFASSLTTPTCALRQMCRQYIVNIQAAVSACLFLPHNASCRACFEHISLMWHFASRALAALTVSAGTGPSGTLVSTGSLRQRQVVPELCQIELCLSHGQSPLCTLAPTTSLESAIGKHRLSWNWNTSWSIKAGNKLLGLVPVEVSWTRSTCLLDPSPISRGRLIRRRTVHAPSLANPGRYCHIRRCTVAAAAWMSTVFSLGSKHDRSLTGAASISQQQTSGRDAKSCRLCLQPEVRGLCYFKSRESLCRWTSRPSYVFRRRGPCATHRKGQCE